MIESAEIVQIEAENPKGARAVEVRMINKKPLKVMAESFWKWMGNDSNLIGWKNASYAIIAASGVIGGIYQAQELIDFGMLWAFSYQQILTDTWIIGLPVSVSAGSVFIWWQIVKFYRKEYVEQSAQIRRLEYEYLTSIDLNSIKIRQGKFRKRLDGITGRFESNRKLANPVRLNAMPFPKKTRVFQKMLISAMVRQGISLLGFVRTNNEIPLAILPLTILAIWGTHQMLIGGNSQNFLCIKDATATSETCAIGTVEYSNDKWVLFSPSDKNEMWNGVAIPLSNIEKAGKAPIDARHSNKNRSIPYPQQLQGKSNGY